MSPFFSKSPWSRSSIWVFPHEDGHGTDLLGFLGSGVHIAHGTGELQTNLVRKTGEVRVAMGDDARMSQETSKKWLVNGL